MSHQNTNQMTGDPPYCPGCGLRLNYWGEWHYCQTNIRDTWTTKNTDDLILENLREILKILQEIKKKI